MKNIGTRDFRPHLYQITINIVNRKGSKMSEESPKVIREYVAGASLAFGIVILAQEALGVYYAWTGVVPETISGEYLLAVFTIIHFVGGFLGGYLVRRRSSDNAIRAGFVTALMAFVIEFVYNFIFVRSFGGNLLALLSLVGGSIIGAFSASRSLQR
jgi:uncharacterized protein YneF (UPF0154 family)